MPTPLIFAIAAARQAGAILREYYLKPDLRVELKSDRSLVSEADLAANAHLLQAVRQSFPEDLCLSEEEQPFFPTPASQSSPAGSQAVWVIDPLDGTSNFSLGLPIWGVLLARLEAGWPVLGVMYFPMLGELYTAEKGKGAWLYKENPEPAPPGTDPPVATRLEVQPASRERPLSFFACCSRTFRRYQVSVPYRPRILGCAAYSYCLLGRGAAVLAFESTPKVWDLAAAWLLVEEAGGVIASYSPRQPFPLSSADGFQTSFPTLAAPNRQLFSKAQAWIQLKAQA